MLAFFVAANTAVARESEANGDRDNVVAEVDSSAADDAANDEYVQVDGAVVDPAIDHVVAGASTHTSTHTGTNTSTSTSTERTANSSTNSDVKNDEKAAADTAENTNAVAQQQVAQPAFNIWQYEVRGARSLPAVDVQKTLYPFLGPNRSLATIEAAANALIALFDSRGYAAAVDIPPQDVVNGVVVLKVTEGVISRVTVSGAEYFLPSVIRDSVPSARPGTPLQAAVLQEEIVKLNARSGDLKVTPALTPGRRAGDLEVDLRVYDELPASATLTLNDHYSAYTTKTRLSGSLSYNNLWQRFHSATLWALTAPEEPDEAKVLSLSYGLPVSDRNRVTFSFIRSDSATNTLIPNAGTGGPANGPANVAGDATIASISYLIKPAFSEDSSFSLAFTYKNVEEDVTPEGSLIPLQTPIEYYTLDAGLNHSYSGKFASGSFGLGFTTSIRPLNDDAEFADKRDNTRSNFFIINSYLNQRFNLPAGFALLLEARGQYTEIPLISNEQWRIGGSTSVRGYLESQELGDYGFDSTLQLETPSVLASSDHSLIFHTFYDYGYAGNQPTDRTVFLDDKGQRNAGSRTDSTQLSSYGLGVQYQYRRNLNASVDWASVLKDSCDGLSEAEIAEGTRYCTKEGDIESGDTRITFNISSQF